jgi:lipoprotein-releasing system ATP-binding protein
MTGQSKTLLECRGLEKTYGFPGGRVPEVRVLRGVDLRVAEGEIVTILGASGSGKSTLLDRPSAGDVLWEGKSYYGMGEEARAAARGRFIGFVFQFHHLLNEFTALENVMLPAMISSVPQKEASSRAEELLAEVGLADRAHHRPAELSGGEQQRVAVARALVNRPAIVLADEPSGNLDSENSRLLSGLIARLHAARRQSFVIVTHNRQFAPEGGRTFTMADGKLVPSEK